MAGESLASNARRALPIRNRFTKPLNEKPFSVGMASSPSRTNLFGLRVSKAATISGKAEVRLSPVLDCKKTFSSSRKTRQRNPSHFGSYIHSLPIGKLFVRQHYGHASGLRRHAFDHVLHPSIITALAGWHPGKVAAVWVAGPYLVAPLLEGERRIGDNAV